RVRHRRGRWDRAALAHALRAEWREGGWVLDVGYFDVRDLHRRGAEVAAEVGVEELAVRVVAQLLEQRATDALSHAADDLPLRDHGADDGAGIVRDDEAIDLDEAGVYIHGDHRDEDSGRVGRVQAGRAVLVGHPAHHAARPGVGALEVGIDSLGQGSVRAGPEVNPVANVLERDGAVRAPLDLGPTADELHVFGVHFEQVTGDLA